MRVTGWRASVAQARVVASSYSAGGGSDVERRGVAQAERRPLRGSTGCGHERAAGGGRVGDCTRRMRVDGQCGRYFGPRHQVSAQPVGLRVFDDEDQHTWLAPERRDEAVCQVRQKVNASVAAGGIHRAVRRVRVGWVNRRNLAGDPDYDRLGNVRHITRRLGAGRRQSYRPTGTPGTARPRWLAGDKTKNRGLYRTGRCGQSPIRKLQP